MQKDDRIRVNVPGSTIHGWTGTVTETLAGGDAGWVQFDVDLPISLRSSVRDKRKMFLVADQVEVVACDTARS